MLYTKKQTATEFHTHRTSRCDINYRDIGGSTATGSESSKSCCKNIKCTNNLKQMGVVSTMYAGDCDGYWPPSTMGGWQPGFTGSVLFLELYTGHTPKETKYDGTCCTHDSGMMLKQDLLCPALKFDGSFSFGPATSSSGTGAVIGRYGLAYYAINNQGFRDVGGTLGDGTEWYAYALKKIPRPASRFAYLDCVESWNGYHDALADYKNVGKPQSSFRHNRKAKRFNATFFDGHVEARTQADSYFPDRNGDGTDDDPWNVYGK